MMSLASSWRPTITAKPASLEVAASCDSDRRLAGVLTPLISAVQGSLGQQQGSGPAVAQIALPLPGSLLRAPPVTSGAGAPQARVAAPAAAGTGAAANPAVPREASGGAPAAGTRSREPSPAAVRIEPPQGRSAGPTAAGAAAVNGASAAMPPPNAGAVASAFATNSAQQRQQRVSPPESPRDSAAGAGGGGGGGGGQHSTAGSPARRVGSLSNWIGEQQQQQHRHGGGAGGYVPATAAIGGHSNPVSGKKLDAAQLPRGPSAPSAAQNHGGGGGGGA